MERLWQYTFPSNRAPPEPFHGLAWYVGALSLGNLPALSSIELSTDTNRFLPSSNKSASIDVIPLSGKEIGPSCRIYL